MAGIVAIVGRPNVGKSTLFNRIVGRRVAITLEEPGITRDRIYKEAHWQGKEFIVVDTGGLVISPDASLLKQIKLQVEVAIREADGVILVVDGREGLTPVDEEIGRDLRKKGKEFLLAVNKIDAKPTRGNINEFYKLGQPFAITAEHGTGVAELLDEVVKCLPRTEPETEEAIRLVILGRPNVGKSSFLNSLLGEYRVIVDDQPGTTRDAIETGFSLHNQHYRIVDTAGIRKKARVKADVEYFSVIRAIGNIKAADVAILIVDLTEGATGQDKRIAALVEDAGKGLVIAGNKVDTLTKAGRKPAQANVTAALGFVSYAPFIFTSATKKEGIVETITAATQVFAQAQKQIDKELLHSTVLAEIKRRPPKSCEIYLLRQTGTRPPEFTVRVNKPELDTGYIRFIKHQLRNYFGFQGNPIKIKIEYKK
jgi:GTP-binding protein